ncbi:MAG: hypothetical protein KA297_24345 [Kofleriaceae bacterium]|jgi:hypothetical protein|nr:hypothetical protein [Kofleriaceae bacterium]MBP6838365.1 hypothetical protein [Kofleriaceae bacterium]
MSEQQGYKRINFFKGFLTTEKDWNDAERYHIDKRMLHNRMLHAPGVVVGHAGELRVVSRARGDLSLEIQPGYAIDGQGHDLVLYDAAIKNINPEEFRLPQTIYVVLRFYEELTDFIAYKENLEYKGHRRVLESCKVELSQTEPDISREIELGRIYLEKGATRVRDARDPMDPRANEIDLRFVPRAGVAGSPLPPHLRLRLHTLLWQMRRGATEYARRGVASGHDMVQATSSALMLMSVGLVDLRSVFDIFNLLVDGQGELALDVEVHHPTIAAKKEFSEYRRNVEILRGLLAEGKNNLDAYLNLLSYQSKAVEIQVSAVAGEKARIEAPVEKKEEVRVAQLADWEGVKAMANPKTALDLEGLTWVLVDEIEILNKESEDKHAFAIRDAKDNYRSRQKLKYPDGTVLEDTGRALVGGYAEFRCLGVTRNKPVVILRRMDYVYGDYELELACNGKTVGTVSCAGVDRVHRWRNWPALIPAEFVTDETLTIKLVCMTAGRDVNMFHLWVYQPK